MAAAAEAEEPSEPLKYKTWFLKTSIHCEGCKRKVKRILHSIEGVYTVDVDSKLHKVKVTGNVEPATLIKKLEKSGKHAEFWQEKPEHKEKKSSKSKKKEKQDNPESQEEEEDDNDGEKKKVEFKTEGSPTAKNNGEAAGGSNLNAVEVSNAGKNVVNVQIKEVKFDVKNPEAAPVGENTPSPEKKVPESDGTSEKSESGGGGGGGKKKKKKGQKGNNGNSVNEGEHTAGENRPTNTESPNQGHSQPPNSGPVNLSPPRCHNVHDYPPRYYIPPHPVYAVSYNTALPTSTYTASYYAAPPPYMHSYAYVLPSTAAEQPPPSYWSPASLQPSDTLEMFSEENPNACSVM
ncbi:hypothetical protein Nepgr_001576 [Nepenthes gracilis]|uniref:HMA domain-containing protein n=1 Tax=Nepenthes gracilis TaxID=150966 RepID=A0AAD3P8Q6_NEPGR|nr:hypothetical protein Nepgr_001576 [Nepenthes gracilis]